MYTNADQLPNKMEELKCFIAGREPDVIIITEVIPKAQEQELPKVRMRLDGYTEFFNFEPEKAMLGKTGKRGIVIYAKNWLNPQETVYSSSFSSFSEQLWITASPNGKGGNTVLIGGIYRSPSSDEETTVRELGKLLDHVMQDKPKKTQLIICGDFNLKGIDWSQEVCTSGSSQGAQAMLKKVQDLLLFQHILRPTRYRLGQTPQTLDLVFTEEENAIESLEYFDGLGLSDHLIVTFQLAEDLWLKRKQQTPRHNYRRADFESMRRELKKTSLVANLETNTTEEVWKLFQSTMHMLVEQHVPKKKPPKKKRNLYMNNNALRLRKKKERLWKRYLDSGQDSDYAKFAKVRNELRATTRNLKKSFEKDLTKNLKTNPKAFWAYVNSKVKHVSGIEALNAGNGVVADTDHDKARVLNSFFATTFTQEDLVDVPAFTTDYDGELLEDIEFTKEEVARKLEELDPVKSSGPDDIHPALLKELRSDICVFLTLFFRKSMDESALPEIWKRGNIAPIFKKGNRHEPENYRPISLTCVACKVMEKFVRDAVRDHLLRNNLISQHQHGFLPGKSTSSQLMECLEDWSKMMEEGSSVDILYLDFKKAFDAVPHKRLLEKIQAYGIRGKVLMWIESFLTERKQRVVINGESSPWLEVTSGIPQGSVLGPLCFLIYINDLAEEVKSSIKLYADDAKLYGRADTEEQREDIQKDIEAIENWTRKWQLPLNINKCRALHLGPRNVKCNYTLNGMMVQKTEAEKDLGIIIDNEMKFHIQNASTVKKANRVLGLIKRGFDFLDEGNVTLLYKIMVRPIVEYCNTAWGPSYKVDQKKVEQIQRRATRLVTSLRHLPYEDRLEKLDLPSLTYRRKRGDMIMVYKIITGRAPGNQFLSVENMGGRTRGHRFKLKKYHAKKDIRRHRFSQRVINDWNNLPSDVVNAESVTAFKRALDEHWACIKYKMN